MKTAATARIPTVIRALRPDSRATTARAATNEVSDPRDCNVQSSSEESKKTDAHNARVSHLPSNIAAAAIIAGTAANREIPVARTIGMSETVGIRFVTS